MIGFSYYSPDPVHDFDVYDRYLADHEQELERVRPACCICGKKIADEDAWGHPDDDYPSIDRLVCESCHDARRVNVLDLMEAALEAEKEF